MLFRSKFIRGGTNTIKLVVYPASDDAVRSRKQQLFGQRIGTGIVREVLLVGTPRMALGDVRTSVKPGNTGIVVHARTTVQNGKSDRPLVDSNRSTASGDNVTVTAVLRSPNDSSVISTSQQTARVAKDRVLDIQFDLPVSSPRLWTPQDPALYTLSLRVESDGQIGRAHV